MLLCIVKDFLRVSGAPVPGDWRTAVHTPAPAVCGSDFVCLPCRRRSIGQGRPDEAAAYEAVIASCVKDIKAHVHADKKLVRALRLPGGHSCAPVVVTNGGRRGAGGGGGRCWRTWAPTASLWTASRVGS